GGAIAVIVASVRARRRRRRRPSRLLVAVAHVLGVELRLRERRRHRLLPGDGGAHLLADVGAEVLELGDVEELDPGVGARLRCRGRGWWSGARCWSRSWTAASAGRRRPTASCTAVSGSWRSGCREAHATSPASGPPS